MSNSKSPAGNADEKSTNVEAALGQAQLEQNPMLGEVKSFYIGKYFNTKEHRSSYGVVINFGRKKSEKKRLPLFFLDEKVCLKFVDDLKSLIGLSEEELQHSPLLDAIIDEYKVKALNYKPKQVV